MIDFHFSEHECLLLANALKFYINAGVLVTEDEFMATDLLREFQIGS